MKRVFIILLILTVLISVTLVAPAGVISGIAGWQVGIWAYDIGDYCYERWFKEKVND